MPTELSTFAASEIDVRYKEDFLSESLNEKLATFMPRGVYTGFVLSTSAAPNEVTIVPDVSGHHAALYETATGFSLALKRSGSFGVTLPITTPGRTYALAIYATYAVGADTTASIRAYEISPTDEFTIAPEFAELVVLGTVTTVSGGGVIPGSDIVHDRRRPAYESEAIDRVPWESVVMNPSFEVGDVGGTYPEACPWWGLLDFGANSSITIISTQARTGANSCNVNVSTTTPDWQIGQNLNIPVTPFTASGGQHVRFQMFYRCLVTLSSGSVLVGLAWRNAAGASAGVSTVALDLGSTNALIDREIDFIVPVPAGAVELGAVFIDGTPATWSGTGDVLRIDDVNCWVQAPDAQHRNELHAARARRLGAMSLFLESSIATMADRDNGILFAPFTTGGSSLLTIQRIDQDATEATQPTVDLHGKMSLGFALTDTAAKTNTPRLSTTYQDTAFAVAGETFTLLWEIPSANGIDPAVRFYADDFGQFMITHNALWNSSTNLWNRDIANDSTRLLIGDAVFRLETHAAGGSATWAATAWDDKHILSLALDSVGTVLAGALSVGSDLLDTIAEAELARVTMEHDPTAPYTLLVHSPDVAGGSTIGTRVYIGEDFAGQGTANTRGLVITSNASYNNTTGVWSKDDTTQRSAKFFFNRNNFVIATRAAGAGTWDDSGGSTGTGWTATTFDLANFDGTAPDLLMGGGLPGGGSLFSRLWLGFSSGPILTLRNGALAFENRNSSGAVIALTSNANPTNPARRNGITPKQVVKAWANIEVPAGSGALIVRENFNVASASRAGLLGFTVVFDDQITDTALAGTDNVCIVANVDEFGWICHPFPDSAPPSSQCTVTIVDDTGTNISVATTPALTLHVVVFSQDTGV